MTTAEVNRKFAELAEKQKKTARFLREIGQQIGGLNSQFGSFTEGLAFGSCRRILRERFGLEAVLPNVEVRRPDGRNQEYDLIGSTNGARNEAVVVEIKSPLRERDLEKFQQKLRELPEFLPEFRGKTIRGLIAAVQVPQNLAGKVAAAGLYLATGADDNFELVPPPPGFQPAEF